MSDRLSRAIQRIAKSDPDLRGAIEATRNRGDQPSAAGMGTSDAERDRICCDGSVSAVTNPGTEERDTSEGGQDGLDPDDTADISDMGPGSLAGITDCATGEPVCFEGSDWVPPAGWDSPSEGPVEDGYNPNRWYSGQRTTEDGVTTFTLNSNSCIEAASAVMVPRSACDGGLGLLYYAGNGTDVDDSYLYAYECNSNFNDVCNDPPPTEDEWPSDGCINLAIRGGSIVGSKYDPENDGTYSKPMSEIELCDDFGNSFYLRPSAGGGWKTINLTNGKDGYLYDSLGNQVARISGSEYSDPNV